MSRRLDEGEEGFLERWSRRKREASRRQRAPRAEVREEQAAAVTSPTAPQVPAAEAGAVDPAHLPDPDTLGPGADFRVFLRDGVPEELKRRALRRLWRTNPIIRSVDMLDDYCEDFTDAATVVAGLRTVCKAGRDLQAKLEEGERKLEEIAGQGDARPMGEGSEPVQGEAVAAHGDENADGEGVERPT